MDSKHVRFKESQLYTWESEPVDERPSEFMSSAGYATHSGYQSAINPVRRARRRGSRSGLVGMLALLLVIIAGGGWAIAGLLPLLHR